MALEDELSNLAIFEDPKAQYFSDMWSRHQKELSIDKKDKIGFAYLMHIIGASEDIAKAFIEGNIGAKKYVGLRQSGSKARKKDYKSFWEAVVAITPTSYSEDDLQWLINKANNLLSIILFLYGIDDFLYEDSPVIRRININAQVYK